MINKFKKIYIYLIILFLKLFDLKIIYLIFE